MITQIWLVGLVGLVGLIWGSFLNVLIWRLNDEKAPKFWQGRSICPHCKHQLGILDNIPLLSFVVLRGRCRYCKKSISWQYPIVELVTAALTIFVVFPQLSVLGNLSILRVLSGLIVVYSFIVIFFSDWIYGLIPDEMVVVGSLVVLFSQISQVGQSPQSGLAISELGLIGENFTVGLLSFMFFLVVVLLTGFRGMGLGDVKLAFLIGFLLGFPGALIAFWSAFILGGTLAAFLILLKRKKIRDTMALGPFLVLGTGVSALWSNQILSWLGF